MEKLTEQHIDDVLHGFDKFIVELQPDEGAKPDRIAALHWQTIAGLAEAYPDLKEWAMDAKSRAQEYHEVARSNPVKRNPIGTAINSRTE